MSLREDEKKMLEILEENDLERKVHHFRIKKDLGESMTFKINGKTYENVSAITLTTIFEPDEEPEPFPMKYDNDSQNIIWEMNKKKKRGIAICNEEDQFNRRIGRVISSGRVLKNMGLW